MNPHTSNGDAPQGQFATARTNAAASVGELNEFLGRLRGKNPHEILGEITKSGLIKATIQATVATIVVVAVFTVGPYVAAKQFPATTKPDATPSTESKAATPSTSSAPTPTPGDASPAATPSPSTTVNPNDVLTKLGENDTKKSSPKVNPLDKKDDDLLKDLFDK